MPCSWKKYPKKTSQVSVPSPIPSFITIIVIITIMIYKQKLPREKKNTQKKPCRQCYLQTHANLQFESHSAPIPLAVNVVIVLFLVNALLVRAPRRCGDRDRRRWQHFRQALELFTLPLDFADAFAALAADVLG